jgi:hypothetical protein
MNYHAVMQKKQFSVLDANFTPLKPALFASTFLSFFYTKIPVRRVCSRSRAQVRKRGAKG